MRIQSLALVAVLLCGPALAETPIEIKGMFIGMTKDAFAALPKVEPTVGGVRPKNDHPALDPFDLRWVEGRLDRMNFVFSPSGFMAVLNAVQTKYPAIQCIDSTVTNRMGAAFDQKVCKLNQAGATMVLTRLWGDVETSSLSLTSNASIERREKAAKEKASDI